MVAFIKEHRNLGMSIVGNRLNFSPDAYRLSFVVWLHYNNKYVELVDTAFMALRKKDRQVSFLHRYHHVLALCGWYFPCKYSPTGECYFAAMWNSFIHVLMYAYYLLKLFNISTPWKHWLTRLQIVQFCACLVQSAYACYADHYSKWLALLQLWVMTNMLVLFSDFYRKAYRGGKPAPQLKRAA